MFEFFDWQWERFQETESKFNVIPAGRRSGKTAGAEKSAIVDCTQGLKVLWVDTINANIDRYVERYFMPDLKESGLDWSWNVQKKILKIEGGYTDFRSADRPESIEGFGYDRIYLNEAGIILNNDYLYTNSILPMLMDYEGSQLFAFGTPKGKINKKGEPHRYWLLWQKVLDGDPNYSGEQLSSYSNPELTEEDIAALEKEMRDISEEAVRQEIYGEFVDQSEDRVFAADEMNYFNLEDFNEEHTEAKVGVIDVADEGMDYLSQPIGYLIGKKIYITDWLFTRENTNFTIPAAAQLTNKHRLDYLAIETNNHGSVFFKEIEDLISTASLMGINQQTKKHSRIIQKAGFVRDYFFFRNDYEVGSDYDKAMKQLFMYTKNGKDVPNDDSPDSISLLAGVFLDLFDYIWYD